MLQVAAETPRLVAMRCASSRSSGKPLAPGGYSADEMRCGFQGPEETESGQFTILSNKLDFPEIEDFPSKKLPLGEIGRVRSL